MHDATLGRTINGIGKVADHTFAEIKLLNLKDYQGNITDFKIQTLEEPIIWSLDKEVLNLDKKDVPLDMIANLIKE